MSPGGPGETTRVGRYSVLRRIGRGGMSQVFRAYDPELDRQVALKLVELERGPEDVCAVRVVREARAMAKISHPNVAPVYDVGVLDDAVYIAMELIDGPTLQRWSNDTPRPWTELLRMYLEAGRGLAAAHDAGLVHRDFKPDNVMVGPDERPRVLDFGLARPAALSGEDDGVLDESEVDVLLPGDSAEMDASSLEDLRAEYSRLRELHADETDHGPDTTLEWDGGATKGPSFDLQLSITQPGVITGTPAYMAPEQHLGVPGGPAADQFSFCVSLWEALYRQRPFEGETAFEVATAVIEDRRRPVPPRNRTPAWLRNLLNRGLAPDPRDRHESMRSLLASVVFTFRVMHGVA